MTMTDVMLQNPSCSMPRGLVFKSYNKRPRAPRACLTCRARKVRCDVFRGWPCGNCKWSQCECKVPNRSRRSGRSFWDTIAPIKIAPIEIAPIKGFNNDGTSTISESKNRARDVGNDSFVCSSSQHQMHVSRPRSSPDKSCAQDMMSISSGSETSPSAAKCVDPSILSFSSTQSSVISGKSTKLPSTSELEPFIVPMPSRMRTNDIQFLMSRGALTLPDPQLRNALLSSFFTHIHPFMPAIDMDEFLEAIRSDGRHFKISLLLFQAVMFAGAACIPMRYLQKLGFDSRKDAREELFTRVRLLYDFDYETDRLVLVQSLLLMTLWYKSPKEHRNTWHWIDVAVSQAFAAGLHVEPNKAIFSRQRCNLRRKIWWSCYATDRLISLTFKRPPKIRAGDFQVSMPEESDFQTDTEPKGGYALLQAMCPYVSDDGLRSTLARLFIDHVGLCHLMDPFLRSYRSPRVDEDNLLLSCDSQTTESLSCRTNSIEKLSALRKQLTEWKASLPQVCHYKAYSSTEFAFMIYLHYTALHFTFQTLMLYTHRLTSIVAEHDQDYAEAQKAKTGMVDAARQISNLTGEVVESGLCRFLPASILVGVVHAAVINLHNARDQEESRKRDSEEGLMQCLEVIRIMEEIHEPATLAKNAIAWAASRSRNHGELSYMGKRPGQDIFADDLGTSYSLHGFSSPYDHTSDGLETNSPTTATRLWSADLEHMEELYPVMMAWGFITEEEPLKPALNAEFWEHSTASIEGLGILNDCYLAMEFRNMSSDTCSVYNTT